MSFEVRMTKSAASIAVASMLLASIGPAAAISVPAAPLRQSIVSTAPVEKVWCRWGCGWGPGAVVGGFAAGAIVGATVAGAAAPVYAPGYYAYGPGYYGYAPAYYGPCWREIVGPYGGVRWQRIC